MGKLKWVRNDLELEHVESLGRAALWSSRNEDCLSVFKVDGGKSVGRTHPGNAQRRYTIERESRCGAGEV